MARVDYRTCHTRDDDVAGYQRTYASGYYAAQWRALERPLLAQLFSALRAQGSQTMLDVACGQGRITLLGAQFFDQVLGIDYSPEMLAVARQRLATAEAGANAHVEFAVGDVADFQTDAPFDVITAFRFFLNAEDKLRSDGLRCVRRNLAPQGTFIASVQVASGSPLAVFHRISNTARRLLRRPPSLVRNSMSLRAFTRLLTAEGFEITRVQRYSLLPRIGSLTDRFAERHISKIERLALVCPGASLMCQSFIVCARLKHGDA